MSGPYVQGSGPTRVGRPPFGPFSVVWNCAVAISVALAACIVLLGRAIPAQATLAWMLAFLLFFVAAMAWLTGFSVRLRNRGERSVLLTTLLAVEGPLFALALAGSIAIYISDQLNHQVTYFLQPTPAVVLLLAVLATAVVQDAALRDATTGWRARAKLAMAECRRWALPFSLLLLGLLQGSSLLWIIGNDFTRYWAITDAISSLAGYPASVHDPSYLEGGMYRYSIELPLFPILLLVSFATMGHDTLAAHTPALLANTMLPLLLFGFYRKAGFDRPLAFAVAALVALFPFFRLYTLNSAYPDVVFVALLVATGYLFLHLIPSGVGTGRRGDGGTRKRGDTGTRGIALTPTISPREREMTEEGEREITQDSGLRTQDSPLSTQHPALGTRHSPLRLWAAFGLLAGLTTVTRPEGLLFVGMMFLGLLPNLLKPRLYLAGALFLVPVVPFSMVTMSSFGIPWPRNAGSSFALVNIQENLDWLWWLSVRWYAGAFGLPNSVFAFLVALLTATAVLGTAWMMRERWQWSLLPLSAGLHVAAVFLITPRVAGADLWYDFFRHISYGLPFAAFALFFLASRVSGVGCRVLGTLHATAQHPTPSTHVTLALLILLLSAYQLFLLSRPSQTYGGGAGQLLTSDVWVTFPDLVAHRYPLPRLPFVRQEGVLMINPDFEYVPRHLDTVRAFFRPYSVINTGRGDQYQLSSLLVLLFGAVFALSPWGSRSGAAPPCAAQRMG